MSTEVLFQTRGNVLVVTFNRPDKENALNNGMAKALSDKLKAVSEDRSLRAVLLRGAGDVFMNGYDLAGFNGNTNFVQDLVFQRVQSFYACIRELATMERPVISAVDGRVAGAGLSIMLASDFVLATSRTIFNTDYAKHATLPDGGATFFLPRKIGASRASELLMLCEDIDAPTALSYNLINKIVTPEALESDAFALAEKLASGPTRIFGATKRLLNTAFENDLNAQLSVESTTWTAITKSFDFREGMGAYAANKAPKFMGA